MNYNYYWCPICGKHRFPESGNYDICPHCGWENDAVMNEDPSYTGGANDLNQIDFRLRYQYYVEHNPDYHWAHDHFPEIPQIEPMYCPVCKKFFFERLTWDDIYCGVVPANVYCMDCGWHYDLAQTENPDLKSGANAMSLNEYRAWYGTKLKEDPNFNYFEEVTDRHIATPHKCPVCGQYEFSDTCCFDICPSCGWEDDGTEDDTEILGANDLRFSMYKKRYEDYVTRIPEYRWDKNGKP